MAQAAFRSCTNLPTCHFPTSSLLATAAPSSSTLVIALLHILPARIIASDIAQIRLVVVSTAPAVILTVSDHPTVAIAGHELNDILGLHFLLCRHRCSSNRLRFLLLASFNCQGRPLVPEQQSEPIPDGTRGAH